MVKRRNECKPLGRGIQIEKDCQSGEEEKLKGREDRFGLGDGTSGADIDAKALLAPGGAIHQKFLTFRAKLFYYTIDPFNCTTMGSFTR